MALAGLRQCKWYCGRGSGARVGPVDDLWPMHAYSPVIESPPRATVENRVPGIYTCRDPCRNRILGVLTMFFASFDDLVSPCDEAGHERTDLKTDLGQRILNASRNLGVDLTMHDAVSLEFAQLTHE